MPSGISGYTRDAGLNRSSEGLIVTKDGHPILPETTIPSDERSVSISADGVISAYFNDKVEAEPIGQLTLTQFTNRKGLEAIGSNLFLETPASGSQLTALPSLEGLGTLRQGYLEESSADHVREVTELIKAQRVYEMNAQAITAADQMRLATVQVR